MTIHSSQDYNNTYYIGEELSLDEIAAIAKAEAKSDDIESPSESEESSDTEDVELVDEEKGDGGQPKPEADNIVTVNFGTCNGKETISNITYSNNLLNDLWKLKLAKQIWAQLGSKYQFFMNLDFNCNLDADGKPYKSIIDDNGIYKELESTQICFNQEYSADPIITIESLEDKSIFTPIFFKNTTGNKEQNNIIPYILVSKVYDGKDINVKITYKMIITWNPNVTIRGKCKVVCDSQEMPEEYDLVIPPGYNKPPPGQVEPENERKKRIELDNIIDSQQEEKLYIECYYETIIRPRKINNKIWMRDDNFMIYDFIPTIKCKKCNGTGKIGGGFCITCFGEGKLSQSFESMLVDSNLNNLNIDGEDGKPSSKYIRYDKENKQFIWLTENFTRESGDVIKRIGIHEALYTLPEFLTDNIKVPIYISQEKILSKARGSFRGIPGNKDAPCNCCISSVTNIKVTINPIIKSITTIGANNPFGGKIEPDFVTDRKKLPSKPRQPKKK